MSLDKVANVGLILAAAAVLTVAWRNNHQSGFSAPIRGDSGKIQSVIGKTSKPSVLLVLSTACHYCSESIPFYQKLAASPSIQKGKVDLIAVFPQETPEVVKYLADNRLIIPSVFPNVKLDVLGITGTPTLVTLNTGKVQKTWAGKLGDKEIQEVFRVVEH